MRTETKTHELKILPEYFAAVRAFKKTAELRVDDRDFRIGDQVLLKEWKPRKKEFSGKAVLRVVTYITRIKRWAPELEQDWVVLHLGGIVLKRIS